MRRTRDLIAIVLLLSILDGFYFEPAAENESVTVNARIGSAAKLEINKNIITFVVRHANKMMEASPAENDVRVRIKLRHQGINPVSLYIMADGDLVSEAGLIPVENVVWQVSGCRSSGGSLRKSVSLGVCAWIEGGIKDLVLRFLLKDSDNYPEGEYRGGVLFALTSP